MAPPAEIMETQENEDRMSTSSDVQSPDFNAELNADLGLDSASGDIQREREEREWDLQMKITRGLNELKLLEQEEQYNTEQFNSEMQRIGTVYTKTTSSHSTYNETTTTLLQPGQEGSLGTTYSAYRHSPSPGPWDPLSGVSPMCHASSPRKARTPTPPRCRSQDKHMLQHVGSGYNSPARRCGQPPDTRRAQTPPPRTVKRPATPPVNSRGRSLRSAAQTPPPTSLRQHDTRSPSPSWVDRLYPNPMEERGLDCSSPTNNSSNSCSSPTHSQTSSGIWNKLYNNGMNAKAKRDRIVSIEKQRRQFIAKQKFKENCTFKPTISDVAKQSYEKLQQQMKLNENNSSHNHSNNTSDPGNVYYRLTTIDPKRKAKTQRDLKRRADEHFSKECTFRPNLQQQVEERNNNNSNTSNNGGTTKTAANLTPKKKDELFNRLYRDARQKEKRLAQQKQKALQLEQQAIKVSHMQENWRYAEKVLAQEKENIYSKTPYGGLIGN